MTVHDSAFYLERADACARDARAATLDSVRRKILLSEASWRSMAADAMSMEASRGRLKALPEDGDEGTVGS